MFITAFAILTGLVFIIPAQSSKNEKDLTLTIAYDNYSFNEELETKWGFSCLVEGTEKTMLFDTGGDGQVLLRNMEKLKIDPGAIEIMVFSPQGPRRGRVEVWTS